VPDPAATSPTRLVAFLRGINLGDRRLKMARLREILSELDLRNVATYMASGNVVFDRAEPDPARLEDQLEDHLEERLGFPVGTFVRPLSRLREITELDVVADAREEDFNLHLILLREAPGGTSRDRLAGLEGADDRFHVMEREVLWCRRGGIKDAAFSHGDLERALGGAENTMRNLNTVRRVVEKFAS
jgi:uncharacterized protein (DUF1697 family)